VVSPLDAAPQTDLQGVALDRSRPADLGQGLWGRPWRSARSDERRPSAQKSGLPDDLAQAQAGVGRLDGLDQPTLPISTLRSGYAGTGQSRTGSTGALTSSQARTGTSCAPLTARFVSVALRNLATRPHPPLPRLWRLYRLDHQLPVKTLRTSHQPTDPTKLLNRLRRSPDSCGDLLIVSALDSGQ